jgi:hypothetical protein
MERREVFMPSMVASSSPNHLAWPSFVFDDAAGDFGARPATHGHHSSPRTHYLKPLANVRYAADFVEKLLIE